MNHPFNWLMPHSVIDSSWRQYERVQEDYRQEACAGINVLLKGNVYLHVILSPHLNIITSNKTSYYYLQSKFEFLSLVAIWFFWVVTIWLFEFYHNLSFWVMLQFEFLSLVTICFFEFCPNLCHFCCYCHYCHYCNNCVTIWVFELGDNLSLSFVTIWVVDYCHILSFFFSFVTIFVFFGLVTIWHLELLREAKKKVVVTLFRNGGLKICSALDLIMADLLKDTQR